LLADDDLSNITLVRTFFGRSEVRSVSFRNTDLSESTLCWNDFIDVDFTTSRLESSDLRGTTFHNVNFTSADLRNTDLRQSTFEGCDFSGADLQGARLTRAQSTDLKLSQHQMDAIDWQDEDGDEPGGG
jgi:uncharacterized protein YjbI with pentapeptide repeats